AGVPAGVAGTTNLIKVQVVGDVLARGSGVGHVGVSGQVAVVKDAAEGRRKFKRGQILVTTATDRSLVPFMEQAAAIITEEPGLSSHAAVVGLNLGIPVVVGVEGAVELLADGMVVTVDPVRGLIYRGRAQVR
ncbi:MAG TPA: pyruvate kinase, partial [Firmicutes bacterium]|nr:pyruvate kinase [Bacillota bacterium]